MGRRKIEIKAIKDDRNRSVTFLKRKGGLFKKAHELSVLCSVDVAVIIFNNNKKLYQYSSTDMRELVTRWTYHPGPNEHKGPADFSIGNDDEDEDDENGTPPHDPSAMLPPHFQAQSQFPHMRHHTPSESPPIPNGVFPHPAQRSHTPQPPMGSRPGSRNDMRRMTPMAQPPVGPPVSQPPSTYASYMPLYGPTSQSNMPSHSLPPHSVPQSTPFPGYSVPPPAQSYVEEPRRPSNSQSFQPPQLSQPQQSRHIARSEPSPPRSQPQQLAAQHIPQINTPAPPPQSMEPLSQTSELNAPHPPTVECVLAPPSPKKPTIPLLDTGVKRLPPGRKSQSIFTPVDEPRSILSQYLAAFQSKPPKPEPCGNRTQSIDSATKVSLSPPHRSMIGIAPQRMRNGSVASLPDKNFTTPSRSNSLRVGGVARPRLTVQIPDDEDNGSATAESSSPRNSTDLASHTTRGNSHSSGVVLPPPSPSASTLLSAGATGPPNPFARPPPSHLPQQNGDNTPVSALPSRFLHGEFLPSPSAFYPEWNNTNTLPSPLNFATPVVGTGPSFLRDDASAGPSGLAVNNKRKSPELTGPEQSDSKRVKVESI